MAQTQKTARIKAHKDNKRDFAELTFIDQARSINAEMQNLEKAVKAHIRRSVTENKPNPKTTRIKNLLSMIIRLNDYEVSK